MSTEIEKEITERLNEWIERAEYPNRATQEQIGRKRRLLTEKVLKEKLGKDIILKLKAFDTNKNCFYVDIGFCLLF